MNDIRPQKPIRQPVVRPRINGRRARKLSAVVASILAIVAIVWLLWVSVLAPRQRIDTSKYQVVYLMNGQAYFGKLKNTSGEYVVMSSPYTAQTPTAKEGEASPTTLLKVSAQVYGPEDSIAFRAEQVAFWQNLKGDSKVSQALNDKESQ